MTTALATAPALPAQNRFAAGARERFAGIYRDSSTLVAAFAQALDLIPIAAGDYTSGVYLHVNAVTAGNAAATTFTADGPFSAVQQVELLDPTGGAFHTYSGFELMLINAAGGYTGQGEAVNGPNYLATTGAGATGGSFGFVLRIPCELFPRDAKCALWNGTTSGQFLVRVTLAPSASIWGVAPTVLPSIRVRVNSHGYQLPNGLSMSGVPFADSPPGGQMYQNFFRQVQQIAGAGGLIIPLNRKGYVMRQLHMITRDGAGARSNAILNADWNVKVDNVDVYNGSAELLKQITWERNRWATGAAVPVGYYGLTWAFDWDGLNGGESGDQWVPTQPGSILEIRATAAAAGSLTIITNDISVTEDAVKSGLVKV